MSLPPQYRDEPEPSATSTKGKGYGATPSTQDGVDAPLLASSSTANAWARGPAMEEDLPEDYKIGVAVVDCDTAIRLAFVRKVYTILGVQILATVLVSFAMTQPAAVSFMRDHAWFMWIPTLGSFVTLLMVYWKRHRHPLNFFLLGLFTVFEAMLVGSIVSYYESKIVLQALLITLGVFIGLTLFTFQTKLDFSSFGPFLFAALMGLLTASIIQIFLPFNSGVDLAVAGFSVLVFSGFILYDTQQIMKRFSVDESIMASLSLFLDLINLFISVLRVLNNTENR